MSEQTHYPLMLLEQTVHLMPEDIARLDRLFEEEKRRGYLASWATFAGDLLAKAARRANA